MCLKVLMYRSRPLHAQKNRNLFLTFSQVSKQSYSGITIQQTSESMSRDWSNERNMRLLLCFEVFIFLMTCLFSPPPSKRTKNFAELQIKLTMSPLESYIHPNSIKQTYLPNPKELRSQVSLRAPDHARTIPQNRRAVARSSSVTIERKPWWTFRQESETQTRNMDIPALVGRSSACLHGKLLNNACWSGEKIVQFFFKKKHSSLI